MNKKEYRLESRQRAERLPEEQIGDMSRSMLALAASLPEYRASKMFFIFVGVGKEPQTLPFILAALGEGRRVCVPLCTGKGIMEAREITSASDVEPGFYGLLEPKSTTPPVNPEEIDFAFIPCAAATRRGERLGHGGGFYDRYMPGLSCPMAMLCFEELLFDELPTESHDLSVTTIVTQREIIRAEG